MIKPKDVDPLNRTYHFLGKCSDCHFVTDIWMFNEDESPRFYSLDDPDDIYLISQFQCPSCHNYYKNNEVQQRPEAQKELDDKINLFFFDHTKRRDDYVELYKELQSEKYLQENGKRYSPLFLIMKEIKQALLLGKEIAPYRQELLTQLDGESIFTSIILIRIAFNSISKIFFSGNFLKFGKDYIKIENEEYLDALNLLRNALEHNFWTLWTRIQDDGKFHKKDEKIYFTLTLEQEEIIVKDSDWKTENYKSSRYIINPRKLYLNFESGIRQLKEELQNRNNFEIRQRFNEHVRLKHWILVSP